MFLLDIFKIAGIYDPALIGVGVISSILGTRTILSYFAVAYLHIDTRYNRHFGLKSLRSARLRVYVTLPGSMVYAIR
jgi:hypothetical protein